MKLLQAALLAVILAQPIMAEEVRYRLIGLFQPDRVADLQTQAGELPAATAGHTSEVRLVSVDYDAAEVTFHYEGTTTFKRHTPAQIMKRIDELLRVATRGSFSVAAPSTLDRQAWRMERIAVRGHACKGCDFALYRCLASLEGVERVESSFQAGHVTAWIDSAKINREQLVAALRKKEVQVLDEPLPEKK